MKLNIILNNLKFLALALALALPTQLQAQNAKLNYKMLYENSMSEYIPYSSRVLEDTKIRALSEKDQIAMFAIGMMYLEGVNVEQDFRQAREWFQKSAELGNSAAMVELANLYTLGRHKTGFDASEILAKKWIKEAEKQGDPNVDYIIGTWYEKGKFFLKSKKKAVAYYYKAAKKSHYNALVKMFYLTLTGSKGVTRNYRKAIDYLRAIRKLARTKEAKDFAGYLLANIYYELSILTQDEDAKFQLMNLSWGYGNRKAPEVLGDYSSDGVGTKKDYSVAKRWYELAIKKYESVYAMQKLALLYLNAPGEIDRDYKKSVELFTRASNLGGSIGAYYLGYMYQYGLGVERNGSKSKEWYGKSKQLVQREQYNASTLAGQDKGIEGILRQINYRED